MSHARLRPWWCSLFVAVAFATTLGCQDQSLGDARTPDASNNVGASTCASLGGTCGAPSNCAVGVGHLAPATSDCIGTGTTPAACCLPQSACPSETFMCCGTPAAAKVRPLCERSTAATASTLVCAAGLTAC